MQEHARHKVKVKVFEPSVKALGLECAAIADALHSFWRSPGALGLPCVFAALQCPTLSPLVCLMP